MAEGLARYTGWFVLSRNWEKLNKNITSCGNQPPKLKKKIVGYRYFYTDSESKAKNKIYLNVTFKEF